MGTRLDHPVSQVMGQTSRFPLPQHQWHRRAGARPCCWEPGNAPGLISTWGTWCPWVTPVLASSTSSHSCENPPVGTAVRMLSGMGAASLPCPRGHPIRGPAVGAGSPGGTLFWRRARRAGIPPQGPGAHPIPHILPHWGTLMASLGRDGIPLEGWDARSGWRSDSPSSYRAISISTITGRSPTHPGMQGEAG